MVEEEETFFRFYFYKDFVLLISVFDIRIIPYIVSVTHFFFMTIYLSQYEKKDHRYISEDSIRNHLKDVHQNQ